jgi:hypothetical protein
MLRRAPPERRRLSFDTMPPEQPGMAKHVSTSERLLRRLHRIFGIILADRLSGMPFTVEMEVDLSKKQQLLDVVVVRRSPGILTRPLPDGLNDLVDHNLITFKSHHEPLDDWTLKELTRHYVAYRKHVSPPGRLVPEKQFRFYGVCARRPRGLFAAFPPEPLQRGVYTCRRGSDAIRIVVACELAQEDRNALLHLFSADQLQVEYGRDHWRPISPSTSSIVNQLFGIYKKEGLHVSYTLEDYQREHMNRYTIEERLAGLSDEEIAAYLKQRREKPADSKKKKPRLGRSRRHDSRN